MIIIVIQTIIQNHPRRIPKAENQTQMPPPSPAKEKNTSMIQSIQVEQEQKNQAAHKTKETVVDEGTRRTPLQLAALCTDFPMTTQTSRTSTSLLPLKKSNPGNRLRAIILLLVLEL
jgi:hypothetical protein